MSLQSKEQSEIPSSRQSKDSDRSQKHDYDELHKDFKKVYRENREQAFELRDLKKQNAQLIEAVRLLEKNEPRNHKEMFMHERSLYEHIRLLEDHIEYLKSQMDKSKHHMESLTFQTREANEEKVALEAKILNLERQNQRLNNDLTECRDDIMRLQPPSQIPDSKIAEQFANLYQEIASWVDDKCEDSQMMDSQLGNLYANKESPDHLKTYLDGDMIRLVKRNPEAEPLILRYVIHCQLHQLILNDRIYFFGLDDHTENIVRSVEESMGELEPKRDAQTLQRWRAETLLSLSSIASFRSAQQTLAASIASSLLSNLLYLLPELHTKPADPLLASLSERIVLPAVALATTMRVSSSSRYRIIAHLPRIQVPGQPHEEGGGQVGVLYQRDCARYTVLDVATGKAVKADGVARVADDGRIGEVGWVVQPLLVRCEKGGGSGGVALVKPVVVGKLDEPLVKRGRGMRLGLGGLGSWFGGEDGGGMARGGN
ncbi:MAG: hypothetical protein LQ351_005684 [Letrouitia transgressa]|nr:MAG: hypothetical protein LQ351_005684 [Letrouitia transgressa]